MATYIAVLLLLGEAVLCGLIIWKVPYTEIDWVAYMQEVQGFLQGELDYTHLKGETGPLVYPAGFVYIYSALHWLTRGGDIFPGQLVFALVYLATQAVVFYIYIRSRTFPPWALALLCLSKRMHSLYVLRLFNDCIAMLLAYIAIALLVERRWRLALLSFSAAVSVKMNVLLMAPPVLVVMLKDAKLGDIIKGTIAGTVLQLLLGAPFLWHSPMSYLSRAFELSPDPKTLPDAITDEQ
ncbi:hypothetical protein WJX72_000071 [[Myrmecia] bisecta]|uniref:dolichyl-P-Man:Man5GlcNAc2-PP-dolichol alpha-1,3-mannosyltransferase n=1 Tax=[Myrmecia] bisecta TaxID=41462 RepID=A0AAW1PS83_9CHLO